MSNKIVLIFIAGILLFNFGLIFTNASEDNSIKSNSAPPHVIIPKLTENEIHAPINITSDIDFIDLGFPGNGTQESPYRIEGIAITGSKLINKLINIENVSSHFIIKNNNLYGKESEVFDEFEGNYDAIQKLISINNADSPFIIRDNYLLANGSYGIKLDYSNFGTIENNTIISAFYAIKILFSQTSVTNNLITSSSLGISLTFSPGSEILNNTIYDGSGIFVYSDDVLISYNIITNTISVGISVVNDLETTTGLVVTYNFINNTGTGIFGTVYNGVFSYNEIHNSQGNALMISASSARISSYEENIISYNLISNTNLYGIVIDESSKNKISNNEILYSGYSGISISGQFFTGYNLMANHNIIEYNNIRYSNNYAVRIGQHSINNSFYNNNFIQNGNGDVQAYDESKTNTFEYNYWDDWIGPDTDGNGIINQPYEFDNNSDKYPLMEPNTGEEFRPIQTQEIVQAPTENGLVNTVKRTITITETIIPTQTVINQKSYDIPSITLFIVFSTIGIMTIQRRNPVINKITEKLSNIRKGGNPSSISNNPTQVQDMNLNIFCTACGTTNPPLSLFCMECGVSQDN